MKEEKYELKNLTKAVYAISGLTVEEYTAQVIEEWRKICEKEGVTDIA